MSSEAITKNDLIAILNQVLPVVPAEYIIGEIKPYAGVTVPDGWLECDGSEVLITDYPLLYAAIGGTWGAASDNDHFVLPNLKGKVLVGQDTSDTSFDIVGETGGAKTHLHSTGNFTLGTAHIPAHTHGSKTLTGSFAPLYWTTQQNKTSGIVKVAAGNTDRTAGGGKNFGTATTTITATHTHDSVGSGGAHNHGNTGESSNVQPYAVVKYIICATVGSSGSGGGGGPIDASSIPSTNKVAKFDSDAFMNSSDMDATELSDFLSGLNVGGGGTTERYSITWGGTAVTLYKKGVVAHGCIWNPRTVAAGSNTIGTLPEGWRPVNDVVWIAKAPNSTSSGVEIRYTITTSGVFTVYNYGSAWSNTDSNITASFMYIVA